LRGTLLGGLVLQRPHPILAGKALSDHPALGQDTHLTQQHSRQQSRPLGKDVKFDMVQKQACCGRLNNRSLTHTCHAMYGHVGAARDERGSQSTSITV
jgi:hypothetical protein